MMNLEKLEGEIKEILNEKNELSFQYAFQPIFEIENSGNTYLYKIIGYEALLRNFEIYKKSISELLAFFSKLEKGFTFHLYLLHLALFNFKNFFNNEILLFFNISPEIFLEKEFNFKYFIEILNYYNFPQQNIVFEITENYPSELYDSLIAKIFNIKYKYDVLFAIDDFGTGNNNWKFFKDLQPYFIKIDKYFVQTTEDFIFLKKMINFFSDYCNIILEGIETKEQFLKSLNTKARLYQGYFFKKPFIFNKKKKEITIL